MSIIKLLTIRKQNYEKDFYLEGYVYPGSSYDIPLKTGEFSHYISINIEESEHYTDDEFLDFLSNMSISFRMEFINKIITKLKQQIETLSKNNQTIKFIDVDEIQDKWKDELYIDNDFVFTDYNGYPLVIRKLSTWINSIM